MEYSGSSRTRAKTYTGSVIKRRGVKSFKSCGLRVNEALNLSVKEI